jgi:hypothetical protein
MITTGAIHITMDVTANFVNTPDIACPDVNAEINIQIPQFSWNPTKKEGNETDFSARAHTYCKQIRSKLYGWTGLYISTRKICIRSLRETS